MSPFWLDVPCPYCRAQVGRNCRVERGFKAGSIAKEPHRDRTIASARHGLATGRALDALAVYCNG